MSSRPELRRAWADHRSAVFACKRWHYARIVPASKLVKVGAWEDGKFIGVVLFSRGATPNLAKSFKLPQTQICELTRVALGPHQSPVSQIVAQAVRMLRRENPGLRLVVSFADPEHGHHGGIYQALGWVYTGETMATLKVFLDGRWRHVRGGYPEAVKRGLFTSYKDGMAKGLVRAYAPKYRYCLGLDDAMRARLESERKPYPKRAKELDGGTTTGEGGATPTRALHPDAAS